VIHGATREIELAKPWVIRIHHRTGSPGMRHCLKKSVRVKEERKKRPRMAAQWNSESPGISDRGGHSQYDVVRPPRGLPLIQRQLGSTRNHDHEMCEPLLNHGADPSDCDALGNSCQAIVLEPPSLKPLGEPRGSPENKCYAIYCYRGHDDSYLNY